jgi:hypothetical protein
MGGFLSTDGIESGSSGAAIIGGPQSASAVISGIAGGITPALGGATGAVIDVDGGTRAIFDDPGVRQPELGRYDTYHWMDDPRLDTDHDGIMNNRDAGVRRYDPPNNGRR